MRYAGILLLCLVLSSVVGTWAVADTTSLRLGPNGEILAWLVLGPLPNPGVPHKACRGFDMDYLSAKGGEHGIAPAEGESVVSTDRILRWRLATADSDYTLDLLRVLDWRQPGVAYAYAALVSPSRRDGRLLLGSDDGVKVWVNGELVHENHLTRGVKPDEDQADIRLNAGVNRLLFKVDQNFGGWGLAARIVKRDGSPASDLVEVIDARSAAAEVGDSFTGGLIRSAAGEHGVLDVHAAMRFEECKRNTDTWMPWFRKNQGKAEPLEKTLKLWSRRLKAARSKDADQLSHVLADAVDSVEQRFDDAWAAFDERIQKPEPLLDTDPAKEDYIRVAPGGRYFVHADGTFYTPIGYNHNPDWTELTYGAPFSPNYDPARFERFFKHLHDSGVNLVRLMLDAPAGGHYLEKPIGTFNAEQAAWLDNIVSAAGKHDIKLMVTPWDTFWMNHRWDVCPYNSALGGLVEKKVDFITRREVIEAQKRRWKFIIDRWGNTGTIFAWELLNESDYWWEASPEQVIPWAQEMGDFVREYENRKWGRNHLITISTGRPMPRDGWGELAYHLPGMDLATTHLYIGAANAPDEPVGPALAEREGVAYALSQIKDHRPYIDGENGPINRWIADEKLDNEVFHNMAWAHMASGGAGSGLRWPYRHPHHLSDGMYEVLSRISRFAKEVPWRKLTGPRSEMEVTVPDGWIACSVGTEQCALIWITSAKPSAGTIRISWSDAPKSAKYGCYDTKTGEWISRGMVKVDQGTLSIPLSECRKSVALILE